VIAHRHATSYRESGSCGTRTLPPSRCRHETHLWCGEVGVCASIRRVFASSPLVGDNRNDDEKNERERADEAGDLARGDACQRCCGRHRTPHSACVSGICQIGPVKSDGPGLRLSGGCATLPPGRRRIVVACDRALMPVGLSSPAGFLLGKALSPQRGVASGPRPVPPLETGEQSWLSGSSTSRLGDSMAHMLNAGKSKVFAFAAHIRTR
jgi:hypothetical protein